MTDRVVMLLTAPLQSWGGPAPGIYERPTDTMPSLSGVVGIIANALGRRRTEPIDDIASGAELAVRADRPGTLLGDFHTIGTPDRHALASDTGKQLRNPVVTDRSYLSDAAFLAVYTPPPEGLPAAEVLHALAHPARPLYLGRRSCPPAERVAVTTAAGSRTPEEILSTAKLLRSPPGAVAGALSDADFYEAADNNGEPSVTALVEMSAPAGWDPLRASIRKDAPATFDPRRLYHLDRRIVTTTLRFSASSCAGRGRGGIEALYDSLGALP
ncbi:MAG: type I-E CRISPR-associated protein Cas5/CasD [Acidimicrobiaceae bacterium]|nr:type I-E CRISPR-associated protein Cas5/CasD [Synechococcus sp. SB0672_bin_6]MYL03428.1 type I-E CRISPR-associated protein Cas5/CasD [Acidimicrobiaceae bacterium]